MVRRHTHLDFSSTGLVFGGTVSPKFFTAFEVFGASAQLRPRRGDKEGMTTARLVLANDVIHIQRRTREGFFFLVPVPQMVRLICFAYALAAARYGLVIHALCIMGTHVHVIATDVFGRHPKFTEYAHRLIAEGAKRMYGIEGSVWAGGGPTVQRLVSREAIVEALAYVRSNPIAGGCVRNESIYPGLFGADDRDPLACMNLEVRRPPCFGAESTLPEEAVFSVSPPERLLDELGEERTAEAISAAVERHRESARRERARSGKGFLGLLKTLSMNVWTKAKKLKRSDLRPNFKGVTAEAIRAAKATLVRFRKAYAEALAAFREGNKHVEFPLGTYLMKVRYGCRVAPELA